MLSLKLITTYEELQLVGAQCTHTRRTFLKMRKKGKKRKRKNEWMNNHLPLRRSLFIWRPNKYLWAQNKKSVSCKIQVSCKNYCKPNKATTCTCMIYRLIASRQVGHYQYSLDYKFIDAYTKPIFAREVKNMYM